MRYYRWLPSDHHSSHGGRGIWRPKRWRTESRRLQLCAIGLHGVTQDQLPSFANEELWHLEVDPTRAILVGPDKMCAARARITEQVESWTIETARALAFEFLEDLAAQVEEDYPAEDARLFRESLTLMTSGAGTYSDVEALRSKLRHGPWDHPHWALVNVLCYHPSRFPDSLSMQSGATMFCHVSEAMVRSAGRRTDRFGEEWITATTRERARQSRRMAKVLGLPRDEDLEVAS